jgi:hypothetical protein
MVPEFGVKPLSPSTWPDFARLVEAHNGVWGGCWCMGFHPKGEGWGKSAAQNRRDKEALVFAGRARAALVCDGADCVGWCQFDARAKQSGGTGARTISTSASSPSARIAAAIGAEATTNGERDLRLAVTDGCRGWVEKIIDQSGFSASGWAPEIKPFQ